MAAKQNQTEGNEMKKRKIIEMNGEKITVSELTVKQVGGLLDEKKDGPTLTAVDFLFGNEVTSEAIMLSTGLTAEAMDEFTPSDVRLIIDTMKEINPFFFDMMGRLIKAAEKLPQ